MTGTKDRIMAASAELFRRNGFTGTGLKQIVAAANAPFGSLYHFFPGGKEQLGEEVIRSSGMRYLQLFDIFFAPAPDLVSGVEAFPVGSPFPWSPASKAASCSAAPSAAPSRSKPLVPPS